MDGIRCRYVSALPPSLPPTLPPSPRGCVDVFFYPASVVISISSSSNILLPYSIPPPSLLPSLPPFKPPSLRN